MTKYAALVILACFIIALASVRYLGRDNIVEETALNVIKLGVE